MTEYAPKDEKFRWFLDAAPDAMVVADPSGRVIVVNQEAERLLGWSEDELLGKPINRLIPAHVHRLKGVAEEVEASSPGTGRHGVRVSLIARRRDASEFPVEISWSPLGPEQDTPILYTIRDLTEWRRAQESLFREKEQAFVTLQSIGDAVITTDAACKITYLNPMAERLTGWELAEALGQPVKSVLVLISEPTRAPVEDMSARCLTEGRAVDLAEDVLLLRRDGTEVPIGDSAAPIRDRAGATIGVVVVFHDVTERRRAAKRLSHEATHDALTGLVNRKEFERRLTRVLADSSAGATVHALLYLDLDRFKIVNDSSSHEAGDELLRKVGALLTAQMRRRDTLARLGGDEFGALLENCGLVEAEEVAEGLRRTVDAFQFVWGEQSYSLGVSIGVIAISAGSGRASDMLRAADAACYVAKEAGGNRVHVERTEASKVPQPAIEARRVTRISRALEESQFRLYAQAIVPLTVEHPSRPRCEILLRLPDENGGLQPAASFLPQAERYNLMPAIDRWVVRQAIGLLGKWYGAHQHCELPVCSINLSASSLEDDGLVPAVRELLDKHGLPPDALCFEIAETVALGNFAQTVRLIAQIRAAGCGVALEDFGNGVTSFAYLKALPVDFLKIGGHYVRGVADDPVYGTIVSAVNQIGKIMGIATIAAKVDSEPVLEKLRTLGIGYVQGHAVAQPQPLTDAQGEVTMPCFERSA